MRRVWQEKAIHEIRSAYPASTWQWRAIHARAYRRCVRRHLANPELDVTADASPIAITGGTPYVTTDAFTVQPLEFSGGDIGSLAVNGTVNDLAVSGGHPLYLTLSAIIEEGLEVELLDRVASSLGAAARASAVGVIAGDTKVVPRGHGGGIYLATMGIGVRRPGVALGLDHIRGGDAVLVSGPLGDHGAAVMLAREDFDLKGDLRSDCAPVIALAEALCRLNGVRFMRDPTRGAARQWQTRSREQAVWTCAFPRIGCPCAMPCAGSVRSSVLILIISPRRGASLPWQRPRPRLRHWQAGSCSMAAARR